MKINSIFGGRRRITIPNYFCSTLNLKRNDFITITLENESVVIRPVKVCDHCNDGNIMVECPSPHECAECSEAGNCLADMLQQLSDEDLVSVLERTKTRIQKLIDDYGQDH